MKKHIFMSAFLALAALPVWGADQLFSQGASKRAAPMQAGALNHDLNKIQGLKLDAKLIQAQSLSIPLPNGKTVEAKLNKRYTTHDGFLVWTGKHSAVLPDHQNFGSEETILVMRDGGVYGNIRHDGASYKIRFDKTGFHSIEKINVTQIMRDHDETEYRNAPSRTYQELKRIDDASLQAARLNAFKAKVQGQEGKYAAAPAAAPTDKPVIRVLVNYTPKAKTQAEKDNPGKGMDFIIAESLAVTNTGYVNSGVNAELVLAHKAEVNYVEAGDISKVDKLRYKTKADGYMDEIFTQRDQYAADIGVLFLEYTSGTCGSSVVGAIESDAFAVVRLSCAIDNLSFPHEVGHMYGARHDISTDTGTTPFAFAHGYVSPDKKWRTVMSYPDPCSSCPRLNYWSNPLKTYNSIAMGVTGSSDNAQALNLRAAALAAFRPDLDAGSNKAPVVNAGVDQSVRMPAAANLSATASDDGLPAGSSMTHTWTKVSGPGTVTVGNASALITTANFSTAGTYVLRISTSDSALTSSDDLTVNVTANQAPVANFTSTSSGLTVQFTDSSTDADGSIASRSWNFGNGVTSTTSNPSHTYVSAGTYTVSLVVTDNEGLTHSKSMSVTVTTTDPAPVEKTLAISTSSSVSSSIYSSYVGAQSFKYGTTGTYKVSKISFYVSRGTTLPNGDLALSIGTSMNAGTVTGSAGSVAAATVTNTSAGSSFMKITLSYTTPVTLNAGQVYYLNLENKASNGAKYYVNLSSSSTSYANGAYYRKASNQSRDMRFEIIGY
jgi:PKD repeat protein